MDSEKKFSSLGTSDPESHERMKITTHEKVYTATFENGGAYAHFESGLSVLTGPPATTVYLDNAPAKDLTMVPVFVAKNLILLVSMDTDTLSKESTIRSVTLVHSNYPQEKKE